MSKTPKFDKALDDYFHGLKLDEKGGQWRICRFSGEKFYVRPEDIEFYKRIRVPLPTLSPVERVRRRIVFSSGYDFFKVKSAATGKMLLAVCPPTTRFKIYEHTLWFSNNWNPLSYGMDFDPEKSFFEEYEKLQINVPRPNLNTDTSNLNSDYTNNSTHLKNCYLAFDSLYGENLYYFDCCLHNKDCVDCWSCDNSEICYKCWGEKLWKCFFCEYSFECRESYFLYDCVNCEYCFMCSNLRNKKYCFFNEQLTKEKYEKRLKEINLGNYGVLEKYVEKFRVLKQNAVRKQDFNLNAKNSSGDWIINSVNCHDSYFATDSENIAYSIGFIKYKDCYDVTGGTLAELCYEMMTISSENNYGIKFSAFVNGSRDLEYCEMMRNCHDCFGCIGLASRSFCIFNKQYTEDEYRHRVDNIKTKMLETGEYGEFFPPRLAPLPYNYSLATAYPGYEDIETVRRYGYHIEELKEEPQEILELEIIRSSELPKDIKDVDNSILDKAVLDESSDRKFRVTKYELDFYRKYNLPLPRIHPVVRMSQWRKIINIRFRFYDRPCAKCGKTMQTTYAPDRTEKNIYCEACYFEYIY